MAANLGAQAFWRTVIDRYTNGQFEEVHWDDARWRGPVQFFDNGPGPRILASDIASSSSHVPNRWGTG